MRRCGPRGAVIGEGNFDSAIGALDLRTDKLLFEPMLERGVEVALSGDGPCGEGGAPCGRVEQKRTVTRAHERGWSGHARGCKRPDIYVPIGRS